MNAPRRRVCWEALQVRESKSLVVQEKKGAKVLFANLVSEQIQVVYKSCSTPILTSSFSAKRSRFFSMEQRGCGGDAHKTDCESTII